MSPSRPHRVALALLWFTNVASLALTAHELADAPPPAFVDAAPTPRPAIVDDASTPDEAVDLPPFHVVGFRPHRVARSPIAGTPSAVAGRPASASAPDPPRALHCGPWRPLLQGPVTQLVQMCD